MNVVSYSGRCTRPSLFAFCVYSHLSEIVESSCIRSGECFPANQWLMDLISVDLHTRKTSLNIHYLLYFVIY